MKNIPVISPLRFLRSVCIFSVLSLSFSYSSQAQTTPASPKQSPATSAPAKQKKAAAARKPATRPVVKQEASPQSGQSAASKPAPARTAGQPVKEAPQPETTAPRKTATSPNGEYKAVNSKPTATPSRLRATASYGGGFNRNDKLLNIGLGLSSYYYGTPVGVSFETGVHDDISVGAQFDYNSGRYADYYYSSSRWGYRAYYLGIRGSYHFNRLLRIRTNKVDLYAGAGLGYQSFRWNDRSYGYGYDYRSGLFFNYFIGGKFYFTPKVAAFAELGYTGLSSSRIGIAFKFH